MRAREGLRAVAELAGDNRAVAGGLGPHHELATRRVGPRRLLCGRCERWRAEVLEEEVVVDFPLISLEMLGEGVFKPRDLALAWFLFEEEHKDESNKSDEEGQ